MSSKEPRKKALIILTNISKLPCKKNPEVTHFTGFDARAVAHLWNLLIIRNFYQIDYCTPEGGHAPLDPKSAEDSRDDPVVQAFLQNKSLVDEFQETMPAKLIVEDLSIEYSLVALVGAHGALVDLATSTDVCKIITRIYEQGGLVCAIGHGLAGAIGSSISGIPFLKGKKVTCSTRTEDEQLNVQVPFFLDERLMAIGAWVINKGPFEINVCVDDDEDKNNGRIISAQNTASVPAWIELLEIRLGV